MSIIICILCIPLIVGFIYGVCTEQVWAIGILSVIIAVCMMLALLYFIARYTGNFNLFMFTILLRKVLL